MARAGVFARLIGQAVNGGTIQPGFIMYGIFASAPTGWLKMNGTSIGNASSGGTQRANADTAALFAALWANFAQAQATVQDSSGNTVSRGASAAADFAANRRIVIPDVRGEFIRTWDDGRAVDSGRAIGSTQTEMIGPHTHTAIHGNGGSPTSGTTGIVYSSANSGTAGAIQNNTGTENRPRNIAFPAFIKL